MILTLIKWGSIIGIITVLALGFQGERTARFKDKADWAQERETAKEEALRASQLYRAQEQAEREKHDKAEADGQAKLNAALADRDAANLRAAGVRTAADRAIAALRRGTTKAPATAVECNAADATARVFRDLFGRCDEVAGVLASYADSARIAGNVCVQSEMSD